MYLGKHLYLLLSAYYGLLELEHEFFEFIGLEENDLSRYKAEATPMVTGLLHEIAKVRRPAE